MTHFLQALDLTFFCSLKRKLNELAHLWHADPKNAGQALSKYSVMWVLHEASEMCLANPSLIPNGFKRAGLFPWNPSAPDKTKLLPGTVYSSNKDTSTMTTTHNPPPNTTDTTSTVANEDIIDVSLLSLPSVSQGCNEIDPLTVQEEITDFSPSLSPNMDSPVLNEEALDNSVFEPPLSSTIVF